jgi:hypothetical protein
MENNPCLVDLNTYVESLQQSGADRNLVEMGQKILDVLEWMESRLDALDNREGA